MALRLNSGTADGVPLNANDLKTALSLLLLCAISGRNLMLQKLVERTVMRIHYKLIGGSYDFYIVLWYSD